MSNRSKVQNRLQAVGLMDRSSVVEAFLRGILAGGRVVPVHELEVRARDAGLLGRHQSITDCKKFKAAKKILGIRSLRIGFSGSGWWGWALPSPETSVDLAIEAPTSVVYDHSRPDQHDDHTGVGVNNPVCAEPDPVLSEWSRGIARLDHGHAPHAVPLHRWRQFVIDCHEFATASENWFKRARALGWDTLSLFVNRHPIGTLDRHSKGPPLLTF
jgi:hypothetical protein